MSYGLKNTGPARKNFLSARQQVSVQIRMRERSDILRKNLTIAHMTHDCPLCSLLRRSQSLRRPVMQINETIRAYDLAEALRGESGKFEVITAQGVRFMVTAIPGHSIANLRVTTEGSQDPTLWIKKVAEYHTQLQTMSRNQAA